MELNTYFNNNDFEKGKVIVALTKDFNSLNLFYLDIRHIFYEIDIEKIEYLIKIIYAIFNYI